MLRDTTLLMQIQLALIGIVVIVGMFYLWRSIRKLEDKVEKMKLEVASCPRPVSAGALGTPESDAMADAFMKQVFGYDSADPTDPSVPSVPEEVYRVNPVSKNVQIEEVAEDDLFDDPIETQEPVKEDGAGNEIIDEIFSEDEGTEVSSANPLSRSKLKKMNLDQLKHLCMERGLSTEGSKSVLTDRLLGLARE